MTKKNQNSTLVLKNYMIETLGKWLNGLSLSGKESRERTRFVRLLSERVKETTEFKKEIQEKYATKDKDGKFKMNVVSFMMTDGKEENKKEEVDFGENQEKAEQEWKDYQEEEFVIDILEGNKSKIYTVADIVLNTKEEFNGVMATLYEEWCEAFESLPDRREV